MDEEAGERQAWRIKEGSLSHAHTCTHTNRHPGVGRRNIHMDGPEAAQEGPGLSFVLIEKET